MRLATSKDIKALDKLTAESYGIPEHQLMEQAGKSIFDAIKQDFSNRKFAIFCGKGNNGGDGFVVARLLHEDGCEVKVYLTHSESDLSQTSKIAFAKLRKTPVDCVDLSAPIDPDAVIIDALLGISFTGAPHGAIKTAIDTISKLENTVISIDTPSGVSADDGSVSESAVKADVTYTLALDKIGLNLELGKTRCGRKRVLDIGIPPAALSELGF